MVSKSNLKIINSVLLERIRYHIHLPEKLAGKNEKKYSDSWYAMSVVYTISRLISANAIIAYFMFMTKLPKFPNSKMSEHKTLKFLDTKFLNAIYHLKNAHICSTPAVHLEMAIRLAKSHSSDRI